MAPATRRQSIFVKKDANPTMDKFLKEVKAKQSKRPPFKVGSVQRPGKAKKFKFPHVALKNAADRVLAPKPPVIDELQTFIEAMRAKKLTLKKVDYRVERGVIIIED